MASLETTAAQVGQGLAAPVRLMPWSQPLVDRSWTAPDGREVRIRPVGAEDLSLEVEFVRGLSKATAFQRLMSAREPSLDELRRWTDVDGDREVALVATVRVDGVERQVGVARYVREAGAADAEFAIVLTDAWQGTGVGRELLRELFDAAKRAGPKRIVGETLSENRRMLALARRLGFRAAKVPGSAYITKLTLDLDQWQADPQST
jgi:acetyltransferase